MIFEPVKPFLASAYQIKFATDDWETRGAAALRRQVFCAEQGISRQSFYKWRARFAESGVVGLQERSRRPAHPAGLGTERVVRVLGMG